MILAHGSVEVIDAIVAMLWLINLALLLPGYFARRARLSLLVVMTLAMIFDAWLVWDNLRSALPSGSTERSFGLVLATLFGILFFCGCFGVFRWMRLPKP